MSLIKIYTAFQEMTRILQGLLQSKSPALKSARYRGTGFGEILWMQLKVAEFFMQVIRIQIYSFITNTFTSRQNNLLQAGTFWTLVFEKASHLQLIKSNSFRRRFDGYFTQGQTSQNDI